MFEFKSRVYTHALIQVAGEELEIVKGRAVATESQAEILRQSPYWEELRRVDPE